MNTTAINYDKKIFKALVNDDTGHVTSNTTFYYRQKGSILWGVYEGGMIAKGTIVGKVLDDGKLEYHYQHITTAGEMYTGYCESQPEKQHNGRIRLFEKWRWTSGAEGHGTSIVEELPKIP